MNIAVIQPFNMKAILITFIMDICTHLMGIITTSMLSR